MGKNTRKFIELNSIDRYSPSSLMCFVINNMSTCNDYLLSGFSHPTESCSCSSCLSNACSTSRAMLPSITALFDRYSSLNPFGFARPSVSCAASQTGFIAPEIYVRCIGLPSRVRNTGPVRISFLSAKLRSSF